MYYFMKCVKFILAPMIFKCQACILKTEVLKKWLV